MKEDNIDDEMLGRWLSGDMSEEERMSFEATDSFKTYQAIAQYSEQLEAPTFDKQAAYKSLQSQKFAEKTKVVQMNTRRRWMSIAAIFIGVIALSYAAYTNFFMSSMESVQTAQQETKEITLPNDSKVSLNVASSISYDTKAWDEERAIELDGEAYFSVTKGKKFSVGTDLGTITVLGTEFNIRERGDVLEVQCFSGKVEVKGTDGSKTYLTKGQAVRIRNGQMETDWSPELDQSPTWTAGESSFHDAPLNLVIEELENQFGIKVQSKEDFKDRRYTGIFGHESLAEAAKIVFLPMDISYEIEGDSLVIVK